MRWPWKRKGSGDQLVVSWSGQVFAYVLARVRSDGVHEVLKSGVERQGTDSMDVFVSRLQGLGLKGYEASAMLWPEQYQVLQIDAPAVAPEELRSAARYQIREMLESHVDDVTLDVMRVGDGQQRGANLLFVVAVKNTVVREMLDLAGAMQWTVSVIDIQETAQRNIQSALAGRDGQTDRANAALTLVDGHQAVLTISANEELFYTRRFELPDGFLMGSWGGAGTAASSGEAANAYSPVEEYVPDYNVGGVSYGNDYTDTRAIAPASGVGSFSADDDKAQRFVVEVQRSLDVWSRSWSSMPLDVLRVYAGPRSAELATWLTAQLGQTVLPMNVNAMFPGFDGMAEGGQSVGLPLLGVLLRTEDRKL